MTDEPGDADGDESLEPLDQSTFRFFESEQEEEQFFIEHAEDLDGVEILCVSHKVHLKTKVKTDPIEICAFGFPCDGEGLIPLSSRVLERLLNEGLFSKLRIPITVVGIHGRELHPETLTESPDSMTEEEDE